ncbi:M20 family metallopeptidase [Devosia sp.]|uniref:M20 family metallopeptidase n=1 Tax=Devosia sp. TaxID=1871048 RepID=UPI002F201608
MNGPDAALVKERLTRYVAIDSTNPALEGGVGEAAMAEAVAADLAALGARVVRQPVLAGRDNILGYFDVSPDLPTIVLDAHLDTVPASATMHEAGWHGEVLFGRGSCDNKGSLVAMIEAARLATSGGRTPEANLVVLGSVDEEVAVKGAETALSLLGHADLILVGEPTNLDVGTWHKGTTRFTIDTVGRSAHSSMPEAGDNAIMRMGEVLARIRDVIQPQLGALRALTGETCRMSVGAITGGGPLNLVPHHCRIGIDVRRVPGQSTDDVLATFDAGLADLIAAGHVRRNEPSIASPAFETSAWPELTELAVATAREHQADAREIGLPFGTNANRIARYGAPTFIVGPGHIRHAHTDEEQIALSQVVQAAAYFTALIERAPRLLAAAPPPRPVSEALRLGRG